MTQSTITIGLLWHSVNSDNLGVGALSVSQIAIIDEVARQMNIQVGYKILCWSDPAKPYIKRPDVQVLAMRGRDLLHPGRLYAAVRDCDIILDISAGDSFADIYGTRRFGFNALAKLVVLAARRPLVLSPQTIGPFQRRWTRLLAGWLMRGARKIVTRDALSSEYLTPYKFGNKLVEATDVAFRLPYQRPSPRVSTPIRFGFNVSGLLFNGGYTENNMFSLHLDYPAFVRAVLKYFSSLPDCEVHLIGHVNSLTHAVEDDFRVAENLASEFSGVVLAPRFDSPYDAKSYIATMDFFCGSRMHACIAAFSSGVPVLPVAYSRKFSGLFGSLGYRWIADGKTQSAEEVMGAVRDAYDRREELKRAVVAGNKVAEDKLDAYAIVLREAFEEAACRTL